MASRPRLNLSWTGCVTWSLDRRAVLEVIGDLSVVARQPVHLDQLTDLRLHGLALGLLLAPAIEFAVARRLRLGLLPGRDGGLVDDLDLLLLLELLLFGLGLVGLVELGFFHQPGLEELITEGIGHVRARNN